MKTITITSAKLKYGTTSSKQLAYMRSLGLKTSLFDNRIMNSLSSKIASEIINDLKAGNEVELIMS